MVKLQPHELDSFDRAILNLIQADNTVPLRVIGERVNLSTAATQRRIQRLRERYPEPAMLLAFGSPWELLVAVVLSLSLSWIIITMAAGIKMNQKS